MTIRMHPRLKRGIVLDGRWGDGTLLKVTFHITPSVVNLLVCYQLTRRLSGPNGWRRVDALLHNLRCVFGFGWYVYTCRTLSAKSFGSHQVDATMKLSLWLAGIILTTTCALTFVLLLDAEAFRDQSLAVLNAFLAYPIIAYSAFSCYQVGGLGTELLLHNCCAVSVPLEKHFLGSGGGVI